MNKVNKLRKFFESYNIDGYIVPKNDEFFSEYTPEFKDNLKFISNFSGSYGFALILKKKNYVTKTNSKHFFQKIQKPCKRPRSYSA